MREGQFSEFKANLGQPSGLQSETLSQKIDLNKEAVCIVKSLRSRCKW